eukprot:TRINITY_DN76397_c0_g1_i1.p1 TRINITY_DN76397_c0_g1~~TRINITY_DN76397_c0_g1_i1.p1  ORF type:complete len:168 (+),score=11.97 TRINITY_DN76397_c0_g1_i1:54-557(+)
MLSSVSNETCAPAISEFTCPICLELFNDPMVLGCACQHMVCREHLGRFSYCPLCRGPVGIPQDPQMSILRLLAEVRNRTPCTQDRCDNEIQICVKNLNGKTLLFTVRRDETVYSLKCRIRDKTGVDVDQQRLIFGGKLLDDARTISDLGITQLATVHLVMRLLGGMA